MKGFSLELSDQPEPLEQIVADCSETLTYGVKTGKVAKNIHAPGCHMISWVREVLFYSWIGLDLYKNLGFVKYVVHIFVATLYFQ